MSVIIQPSYSPATELTHARIGYESIAYGKTPTASTSAAGYPAIAATYPTTYEFWKPTAVPATWAIDNAVAVACDYVGLVGDFNGGIVDVQSSNDGGTWITQVSGQITGRVTMFLFQPVTAQYWRIQVSNQIPSVSVVYIGQALAMQRRIYQGHSPLTLSRNTELTNNISEGGQYLGRSIVRQGVATDAAWSHLQADWYRENFDPFVRSARTMPFFFAWRPSQFGQELGFVWTDGDIQPQNTGPRDYMSVSLNMRGVYNTSRLLLPGFYDLRPSQILTASRASTATYIDGAGVLQTAAVNVPRFTHQADLPNILAHSGALSQAVWVKGAGGTGVAPIVTDNAELGVHGANTASLVVFSQGAGSSLADQSMLSQSSFSPWIQTGVSYISSFSVRAATSADVGKVIAHRHVAGAGYQAITLTAEWQAIERTEVAIAADFSLGLRGTFSSNGMVSVLVDGLQLERGSIKTVYRATGPQGGLSAASVLLVEGAAANMLLQSANMPSGWLLNQLGRTPGQADPFGGSNGALWVATTDNAQHFALQQPAVVPGTYRLSIFAKADGAARICLWNSSTGGGLVGERGAVFNVSTGAVEVTTGPMVPLIEALGDAWFRCSILVTSVAAGTATVGFGPAPAGAASGYIPTYAGDGVSGVLVYGAQLEPAAGAPSSYIPTTTAPATRAADLIQVLA
jgi:hypothetical protein